MPRARRPLIALVVLIAALIIGYTARALRSGDDHHPTRTPTTTVRTTP